MPPLLSRLGIRGQLLIAPAVVLLLMAVNGLAGYRGEASLAVHARSSAAETTAVEILRDSNSRMFEGDRFMGLALRATTPKDFKDMVAEDARVMDESVAGFRQFAAHFPRYAILTHDQLERLRPAAHTPHLCHWYCSCGW